jgi:hypothetical protein
MINIPKRLLIHSAILKTNEVLDDWGNDKSHNDVNLLNVRYERTTKLVQSPTNKELILNAILWFDTANSLPSGTTFEKGQEITFDGEVHKIEVIKRYYDDTRLSHYELGLL